MRYAFLLLALCACAGSNKPEETMARPSAIFQSAETGTLMGEAPHSTSADIAAPPASVWLAVKKVYADMEIPVTLENPAAHQIGNQNFYKARSMAGQSMTQFVDCGSGMTGPKASSYRIYMTSVTTVGTDGKGGTNIQTVFVPSGQDLGGSSSDRIPCGTTGRFEALIIDRVKATLGK